MLRKFSSIVGSFVFCALLLSAIPNDTYAKSNEDIISSAKQHIGVPYKFGGTTTSGFDCSGYVNYVFDQFDISLPRSSADMYTKGEAVQKADLQAGDLVFFETYKKGASHVGIYIGDNQFIHASTSKGVITSSINDPYYWGSRYLGAKRVTG